jgi:hypothetical protein
MPDEADDLPRDRPDFSNLSISDMLTRMQRAHIENLLALAEEGTANGQILAQINRFLTDNGIIVAPVDAPKVIEGKVAERKALPNYGDKRYDE